ncbi:uncharacterized protein PRCAT00000639001 [Priceomyces carsonii]|nr:unnamed protein product [Priceomyces carsonii]
MRSKKLHLKVELPTMLKAQLKKRYRQLQDSNLRGQSPKDF